jgi:hypothetical protein
MKKDKNGNLKRALKKIHLYLPKYEEWYGDLTAQEILALIEFGASYVLEGDKKYWEWHISYYTDEVKKGIGGVHNFYFKPSGKLKEYLKEREPEIFSNHPKK